MTEEETVQQEPVQEQGFVPLKPRAYHIPQDSIDICNAMERSPADTIVALSEWVESQKVILEERDKMIASLKNIVPTDGRPVYTLQEIGEVVRKVTQIEGVNLSEKQKGFFREVFASFMKCVSEAGMMRK